MRGRAVRERPRLVVPADAADRPPPHDMEAERAVLGAVLLRPELIHEAGEFVTADDFYRGAHRLIWRAMLSLDADRLAIDLLTIAARLREQGNIDDVGGQAYIASLIDGVPRSTNASHYARIVRDLARKRRALQAITLARDRLVEGDGEPGEVLAELGAAAKDDRDQSVPTFRRAEDVITDPPQHAIVDDLIYPGCVTVLAGASGSGKTFLALSIAAAVSQGRPWFGGSSQTGTVAYVGFEGDAIGARLLALQQAGQALEHLTIMRAHDPISPVIDRDRQERPSPGELGVAAALDRLRAELARDGRPPVRLIVIDTVRASLAGSEDSSEHVSAYLRAVRRLAARVPDAGVLLVHHTGWQDGQDPKRRERGSSALRGNVDLTLLLETGEPDGEGTPLVLRWLKVRDGARPAALALRLRPVVLADGRTSCVVVVDERPAEVAPSAEHEVLQAIAAGGITGVRALTRATGLPWHVAHRALRALQMRGAIVAPQSRRGVYRLANDRHE
jgi:hypothetical protein